MSSISANKKLDSFSDHQNSRHGVNNNVSLDGSGRGSSHNRGVKRPKQSRSGRILSHILNCGVTVTLFFALIQIFDPTLDEHVRASIQNDQLSIQQGISPNIISPHIVVVGNKNNNVNNQQQMGNDNDNIYSGRERVLQLLRQAGLVNLTSTQLEQLPKWDDIERLYGADIIVRGKERCVEYRSAVKLEDRLLGVAGMFNTGTNLLDLSMQHNIRGLSHINLWQVPWGKHRMAYVKWNHTAPGMDQYNKSNVLAVVIIRDPFSWMHSMCKAPYAAHWRHKEHHCPNLVMTAKVDDNKYASEFHQENPVNASFKVKVKFDSNHEVEFNSLAHLWSEWYQLYVNVDYPILMIRYEDLVFQPSAVLKEIADCAGALIDDAIKLQLKTSKSHGSRTDLIKGMIKTADTKARLKNMTDEDFAFAKEHLDQQLMAMFRYKHPSELSNTT